MANHENPVMGVTAALTGIVLFVIMDAFVKWLGARYPVHQLMFFRTVIALIPVSILVWKAGGISVLKTDRPTLHILRSVLGIAAMGCAFYGLTTMKLADAAAVFHTAPLLAVAFSVPILSEKVGLRRWTAICLGLTGALLIVRPGGDVLSQGGIVMLCAAIFVAITTNLIRLLNQTDHPVSITFYFTLSGALATTLVSWQWGWVPIQGYDLIFLCVIGILGGLAQYAMSLSFRYASVSLLSPFKYMAMIFSGLIGYFIWSEVPDTLSLIGMTVILLTGLYTLYRETQLGKAAVSVDRN